jgi:Leucine-rich repeat (LRR) protein
MSSTAPTDEPTDRLHLILGDKRQGDYRRRGLSEIPAPLPAGLRRLDLSHNDLAELRLLSVPSLTELRLHDNLLTSVAMHRAGPLPFELQLLDLSNNRLVALPPSVLQLSSLRMLQLGGQRLRALPRQLSLLSCLAQLEAQDNELDQALVLDAPGLPQLSRLNLSGNRLSNLRLSLDGSIPLLTDLDLSSNKIITWPDALSGLPELRRLSLENNGLRSVRSSASLPNRRVWMPCSALHQLSHLSELNLARNELSELPPEIQPLTELTNLDVSAAGALPNLQPPRLQLPGLLCALALFPPLLTPHGPTAHKQANSRPLPPLTNVHTPLAGPGQPTQRRRLRLPSPHLLFRLNQVPLLPPCSMHFTKEATICSPSLPPFSHAAAVQPLSDAALSLARDHCSL